MVPKNPSYDVFEKSPLGKSQTMNSFTMMIPNIAVGMEILIVIH